MTESSCWSFQMTSSLICRSLDYHIGEFLGTISQVLGFWVLKTHTRDEWSITTVLSAQIICPFFQSPEERKAFLLWSRVVLGLKNYFARFKVRMAKMRTCSLPCPVWWAKTPPKQTSQQSCAPPNICRLYSLIDTEWQHERKWFEWWWEMGINQ